MDNIMSTAFMHRSGGSSSASSTGTGSSSGGGPGTGNTGGSRMAVIGVTRNVRLRRRGASGFGFSLRGGREYAAGFYVSDVQPGGEAHRAGLRVGDQIIRVNGYPVEDAVHQEVALLAKNQQVLVLKIRSVGMVPVKDNPNDPVTWHMVQGQQQQIQCNETGGTIPYNEVRIRVMVGEKGRLGCGVCRGIVPGLTVQGTREGGPARAAGLKAGDVIVWCNGQRLTEQPFEKAIEVMRGAAILDLLINRPIPASNGLYDCPETLWMRGSSGYDSESSSIGPVSPPHGNPPSPQHQIGGPQRYIENRNGRACCPLALSTSSCSSSEWNHPCDQGQDWTRKPNNTTVIRVNQNMNQNANQNQYRSNIGVNYSSHPGCYGNYGDGGNEPLYDPVPPKDYESHDFDANPLDERNRRLMYEKENIVLYDPPGDERITYSAKDNGFSPNANAPRAPDFERKTVTTVEVHQSSGPPAPPCPPPMSYKWQTVDTKPIMGMNKMGSTMSMGSTGSTETESSLESCGKDSASTSSSLSTSSCEPASSTLSYASTMTASNPPPIKSPEPMPVRPPPPPGRICPPINNTDLGTAITQELQRRAQQRAAKAEANKDKPSEPKKPQNPDTLRAQENKVTHDKLMEEFKRAHQKMFNGNLQKIQSSEPDQKKEQEKRTNGVNNRACPPPPPLPASPTKSREDAVEMQSIESFKLKESPSPVVPKPPATYFSASSNSSPSSTPSNGSPRHSIGPKQQQQPLQQQNGNRDLIDNKCQAQMEKKAFVKIQNQNSNGPIVANNGNGKVAVKIGAYEGETKQPSRLEFLPQGRSTTDSAKPLVTEEVTNGPVVSRLQNELVATLQRSNLRKKTEEENGTIPQSPAKTASSLETTDRPVSLLQSNVEKLAAAIANRVTIKVSPENGTR